MAKRVEPNRNVYVGHRYVPKIFGEWDKKNEYEGLSIVTHKGASYTSKKRVPVGIDILNEEYWVVTGNYDAQVEYYRDEVKGLKKYVDDEVISLNENTDNKINNFKDDMNTVYNDFKNNVNQNINEFEKDFNTKINDIEDRMTISPEDFEGSDIEKIQQAYEYAHNSEYVDTIKLNREYDLTGGSIILPDGRYTHTIDNKVIFTGGALIKDDAGFMFTRNDDQGNDTNSPHFYNVKFKGTLDNIIYIINGDKMIRSKFHFCNFWRIALIKTSHYTQSLKLSHNIMYFSPAPFIKSDQNLDMDISHNDFEESHFPLIETINTRTGEYANNGVRIVDNLIEGYVNSAPIVTSSGLGLVINNNYFEANKKNIQFVDSGAISVVAGEINGNYFVQNKDNVDIEITPGKPHSLSIQNNISNINGVFLSDVLRKDSAVRDNYIYSSVGELYPVGSKYIKDSKNLKTISTNDDNGLTVDIEMGNTYVNALLGKSYLVSVGASFGSSTDYRANYTGILSFVSNYKEDSIKCEVVLNHLVLNSVGGNINGNETTTPETDILVTFKETGSNRKDIHVTEDMTISLNFPKLKNISTNVAFKPIEDILLQGEVIQK